MNKGWDHIPVLLLVIFPFSSIQACLDPGVLDPGFDPDTELTERVYSVEIQFDSKNLYPYRRTLT